MVSARTCLPKGATHRIHSTHFEPGTLAGSACRMTNSWEGTFEIWENEAFGKIYAEYTGMNRVVHQDTKDMAIFISRKPLIGNTTLYVYNLRDAEKSSVIMVLAKEMRAARVWVYTVDEIPRWHSFREFSYTSTLDLALSEDELWLAMGTKTRNMVRRGIKDGVEIEVAQSEDQLSDWWKIYARVSRDKNFSTKAWSLVHALFKEQGLSRLFIAIGGGRIIGGCFFLVNRYPMYWLGAFDREYREYRSGNLNMWRSILYFKSKGYKVLDLGGIKLDDSFGPDVFKRSFNGETRKAFIYQVPIGRAKFLLLKSASFLQEVKGGFAQLRSRRSLEIR